VLFSFNVKIQVKLSKDISKFMTSLDFTSAKVHATVDEASEASEAEETPEDENESKYESKENTPDQTKAKESNKPDVRIAEVTAKVIENNRGSRTKFVRMKNLLLFNRFLISPRLSLLRHNGTLPFLLSAWFHQCLLHRRNSSPPKQNSQRPY